MGSLRRSLVWACGALAASTLLGLGLGEPAGAVGTVAAVPTKSRVDVCGLITTDDLLGMHSPGTLDASDRRSATHCRYRLDGGSTIDLYVEKPSHFRTEKARTKAVQHVGGLPSGYAGGLGDGRQQVGFTSGGHAVRLTSSALERDDLIVVAKAVQDHL